MGVEDMDKGRRGQKAVGMNRVEGCLGFIGDGALDLEGLAIVACC